MISPAVELIFRYFKASNFFTNGEYNKPLSWNFFTLFRYKTTFLLVSQIVIAI